MNFKNNINFQVGFILIMCAVGVKLAESTFDLKMSLSIVYGLMILVGFILMVQGIYDSCKKENLERD